MSTGIDYEALAKAAYEAFVGMGTVGRVHPWERCAEPQANVFRVEARAVVAALREQGLVVAMDDDVNRAVTVWYEQRYEDGIVTWQDRSTRDRLAALVAAPESAEGGTDG